MFTEPSVGFSRPAIRYRRARKAERRLTRSTKCRSQGNTTSIEERIRNLRDDVDVFARASSNAPSMKEEIFFRVRQRALERSLRGFNIPSICY